MRMGYFTTAARTVTAVVALALGACGGGGGGSSPSYSIGGSVSGLAAGQSVSLQDNGASAMTVSANGSFTFATPVAGGSTYVVTATPSAGIACTVNHATGVATANVSNVAVACASLPAYTIGGTLSGLASGQSVALVDNGGDTLVVSSNGVFTFATPVVSGLPYVVGVATQPAGQYCDVSDGSGTANAKVTSVGVTCHDPFTVGGTVSGLVGQGLQLVLDNMTLDLNANGSYVFPSPVMPSHSGHGVSVGVQPHSPVQHCIVQNPYFVYGGAGGAPITNVNIVCGEFAYVTDAAGATVTAYSIDATSGALSRFGSPVGTGASPAAIAGATDKQYLYVSDAVGNAVSGYAVDAGTGALAPVPGSPFATGKNPGAITVKSETWCTSPGPGGNRCAVRPIVYVANTGADSISTYAVDQASGTLASVASTSLLFGAHPAVLMTGDYDLHLYAADSAASSLIYTFDSTGGGISTAAPPLNSHGKVTALATASAMGQGFLYAANASGAAASILGFSIEPFGGGPQSIPGSLTPLAPHVLANCRTLVGDRNGNYIYAATDTSVYGYSIAAKTGALVLLPGFPVATGVAGDAISLDPSNQFLYVVGSGAGKVAGFRLDAATGALVAPIAGSPFAVGGSAIAFATL
jgi:6-phosphogluconolactonase (cycloisomerase 2 family)